jgi:hypothetical protein
VLIDRSSLSQHLPWIIACVAVAVLSSVWYFAASASIATWPGGSSFPGFTFGVLGGLICLFEFLLWPRKKFRAWRVGRTQHWMRAHIWLGLLAVPLLIYHSGFRWGGSLSTILMVLFLVVIASGVWGLVFQQFLPRKMLIEVPAETIYSQISRISGIMAMEAERLVLATCGGEGSLTPTDAEEVGDVGVAFMVVGKVRHVGGVQGMVLETLAPSQPITNTEFLANAFRDTIRTYLEQGAKSGSLLASAPRAAQYFQTVRGRINPEANSIVAHIEGLCDQRRQFDVQERMHWWLHSWLLVHLPLSAALILLMFVHIIVTLKYW